MRIQTRFLCCSLDNWNKNENKGLSAGFPKVKALYNAEKIKRCPIPTSYVMLTCMWQVEKRKRHSILSWRLKTYANVSSIVLIYRLLLAHTFLYYISQGLQFTKKKTLTREAYPFLYLRQRNFLACLCTAVELRKLLWGDLKHWAMTKSTYQTLHCMLMHALHWKQVLLYGAEWVSHLENPDMNPYSQTLWMASSPTQLKWWNWKRHNDSIFAIPRNENKFFIPFPNVHTFTFCARYSYTNIP